MYYNSRLSYFCQYQYSPLIKFVRISYKRRYGNNVHSLYVCAFTFFPPECNLRLSHSPSSYYYYVPKSYCSKENALLDF